MLQKVKDFAQKPEVKETVKTIAVTIAIGVVTSVAINAALAGVDAVATKVNDEWKPRSRFTKTESEE